MKLFVGVKSSMLFLGIVGVALSVVTVTMKEKGKPGNSLVKSQLNRKQAQTKMNALPQNNGKGKKSPLGTPNAIRSMTATSSNSQRSQGPGRSHETEASSSDLSNQLAIFYGIWNNGSIDSVTALDGTEVSVTAETYGGFMDLPGMDRRVALYQDTVAGWETSRQIYALTLQGNLYFVSGEPTRLNALGNVEGGVRWIRKIDPRTGDVLATDYAPSGIRYWYGGNAQYNGDVLDYFDGGFTIIGDKIYYYSSSGNIVRRQFGSAASTATRVATGFYGALFSLGSRLLTQQVWPSYTYHGDEAGMLSVGLYQIPTGSIVTDPTGGLVERVLDGVPLETTADGTTTAATIFAGDRGLYWSSVTRWSGTAPAEIEVYCLEPNRWSGIGEWNPSLVARMGWTASYGTNRLPNQAAGVLIDEAEDKIYVTAYSLDGSSGDAHAETIYEFQREGFVSTIANLAGFSFTRGVTPAEPIDFTFSASHGIQFLTLH